ncbi:MAG: SUMF1/EgtB/PvdO family nonheme iron enzyme [Planctomycetaceae bacterium]
MDDPQRWALLIGVNQYDYARELKYCVADQESLSKSLIKAGFPDRQVTLMTDEAKEPRLRPSKGNIKKQVELLCQLAERGDLVFIAFSGHGVHLEKTSYLCPTDAQLDDTESLISLEWIYEQLGESAAELRLVMVDACRNVPPEPEGRRAATDKELKASARAFVAKAQEVPEGILLLNSCTEGEFAQEHTDLGHGVFTHFLLQGLEGKADKDQNKRITLSELFTYASKETTFYVRDKFADSQRPKLKGNLAVDVLDYEVAISASSPQPVDPPGGTPSTPDKPGEPLEVITNSLGMKLVLIPAGEFEMGSHEDALTLLKRFPEAKPDDIEGEFPVHKVRITQPFYLGQHEVTLGQFLKFYHAAKYKVECERDGKGGWGWTGETFEQRKNYRPWSWGFEEQTMNHPVVNVTWNDANAFCNWLSEKEGHEYRLPTEAQWEYACRAGSTTRFYFGNDVEELVQYSNLADQANKQIWPDPNTLTVGKYEDGKLISTTMPFPFVSENDGYGFTAPVGRFKPNPFSLYDMHGNVSEWCRDWYGRDYYAKSAADDPQGSSSGDFRVLRGGSWYGNPQGSRSAIRGRNTPDDRYNGIGLRVSRTK